MKKILISAVVILALTSPSASANTFSDVEEGHPYFIPATYLSDKDIVNGYPDGTFRPFNEINRAELLKILIEGANISTENPTTNCFPDVPFKEWYAPYVCTAKSNGFISGYPDGTFKPEQFVNKVEAIKMLGEIYDWNLTEATSTPIFSDTPENQWYAPYLKYAKMKNFLPSSGDVYNPDFFITRGSISETLYRQLATLESGEDTFSITVINFVIDSLNLESSSSPETIEFTNISGLISDALTGNEISATISLFDALGNFIAGTESDDSGVFGFTDVPYLEGSYLIFSKDGYYNSGIPIEKIRTTGNHFSLSRIFTQIDPEELRIVVTWGNSESDLDAHLIDPENEEIFFMHRLDSNLNIILDVDSTNSYGTETITISNLEEGQYEYFVHQYSGEDNFYQADARIEIYNKNGLAKTYYPENIEGTIWKAFLLNSTGELIHINEVGDCTLLEKPSSVCPIAAT